MYDKKKKIQKPMCGLVVMHAWRAITGSTGAKMARIMTMAGAWRSGFPATLKLRFSSQMPKKMSNFACLCSKSFIIDHVGHERP